MTESGPEHEEQLIELPLDRAGDRLRRAREAKGLTLAAVAAQTKIPERHLRLIEAGDFAALPGRTYAIGFGRTTARALGLDENELVSQIRSELDGTDGVPPARNLQQFEVDDPVKVPSAKTAVIAALVGIGLLVAVFLIWRNFFFPGTDLSPEMAEEQAAVASDDGAARPAAPAAAPVDPAGEVAFTSREEGVWVKFYDGSGKQLMQKQMAKGERYVVPADADNPQIWTGRPDALDITIGGKAVAALGTAEVTMKDVPVSAKALLARTAPSSAASGTPAAGR